MSVCGRVAFRGSHGPTMARPGPKGNRRPGLFPRLLRGLRVPVNPVRQREESALEKRLDALVKFLERGLALDLLAIDEKGRRRIDLQHLASVLLVGSDLVEQRLILEAILDLLLAKPGLLADPRQGLGGVL